MNKVIAILCSDLHLSLTPPAARANEKDWLGLQKQYVRALDYAARVHGVPIFCAGDVFDRWNPPIELVNWALDYLPPMVAVPGQHDMPNHDPKQMERSAFTTLVKADRIRRLTAEPFQFHDLWEAVGAGWGEPTPPVPKDETQSRRLLVMHRYVWMVGHTYGDAPKNNHVFQCMRDALGLRVAEAALVGDNHSQFLTRWTGAYIFNHGTMVQRKADEQKSKGFGLLHADGTITLAPYPTALDQPLVAGPTELDPITYGQLEATLRSLQGLGVNVPDFRELVVRALRDNEVSTEVKTLVREALEHADNEQKPGPRAN